MRRTIFLTAIICLLTATARADDWPQWLGPQRDAVWRESGVLDKFPEGGPKVLWRADVGGGYAGPAVADGKVYHFDFVTEDGKAPAPAKRGTLKGKERVFCYNAADGKPVWKHEYDCTYTIDYPAGPRCTPTVAGGKVYTLGSMGHLHCLDAAKGTVLWAKDFLKDYNTKVAMWGYASHPLVDGDKLFCVVGREGNVAVAFNKDTGEEIWKALSAKEQGYCPPTLITAGGTKQLLIWDAENLSSLDPATGKEYWSVKLAPAFGMAIAAPRQAGDYLFASGNGGTSILLKLAADKPAVTEVWRGDKKISFGSINMTPFVDGDTVYGVDQPGQLRGVKLATGERLWESFAPVAGKQAACGTAFVVKNGDRYFLFNDLGDLIIAKLTPEGYQEISRAHLLEPTGLAFGRQVVWSHPAFANRCLFARNDKELICVALAK